MFQHVLKRDSKKMLDFLRNPLFTRSNRMGESELVLTNNSGIFGVYWAINNHHPKDHTDLHVVCFPFWVDRFRLHDRHKINNFGQSTLGLPTIVRSVFKKIYPNYPLDKLITIGMIQEARDFTLYELQKKGVHLHDLRHESYPLNYNGLFEINTKQNIKLSFKDQVIVNVPSDTKIYNWLKVPRLHGISALPERPHTTLYTLPPEKVPSVILVLGDGVSVVWLKRDFPNSKIIAIVPDNHKHFPKIPANNKINVEEIITIKVDDILSIDDLEIIIKLENGTYKSIPTANFFSAIGYVPYTQLTDHIPQKQKTDRMEILPNSWVAGKNIPVGSLTQSLMKFFEETENLENSFELQFYHTPCIVDVLKKYFYDQCNINLQEAFFERLKNDILKHDNPFDEAGELDLFTRVFVETHRPSQIETESFRKAVQEFQQNRQSKINNLSNYSNTYSSGTPSSVRQFSSFANYSQLKSSLNPEIRMSIKKLISVFFHAEKEKVKSFDEKKLHLTHSFLLSDNKDKLKSVLNEAAQSKKTLSVY